MLAVFDDADENIQNATGPIDDGYIANSVGSLPGDPLCCAGPEPLDDGKSYITLAVGLPRCGDDYLGVPAVFCFQPELLDGIQPYLCTCNQQLPSLVKSK